MSLARSSLTMKPYCTIRFGKHVLFGNCTETKFSECKLWWFHLNFITYSWIKQSLDIDVFCQKLASYELLTTQVARVKAEYPNQLDYMGYHEFGAKKSDNETILDYYVWQTCSSWKLARRSLTMKPYWTVMFGKHVLLGNCTETKFSECKLWWFHPKRLVKFHTKYSEKTFLCRDMNPGRPGERRVS